MATKASEYYPSKIKFKVLPHKIYKLSWEQFGEPKLKLLTKAMALKMSGDPNTYKGLRDELVAAFERGDIE